MTALRDSGGEAAAGTPAGHSDPLSVDSKLVGAGQHPSQRRHAVIQTGRERVSGANGSRRDHDGSEFARESTAERRLELWRA